MFLLCLSVNKGLGLGKSLLEGQKLCVRAHSCKSNRMLLCIVSLPISFGRDLKVDNNLDVARYLWQSELVDHLC